MEYEIKVTLDGIDFIVFYTAQSLNISINHVSIATDYDGNNILSYLSFDTLKKLHAMCIEQEESALSEVLEAMETQ